MHTKNLFVSEDGSTLRAADPINRCIGVAYGWDREFEYDANRKLINDPKPNDEARANAKLWAAAADLAGDLRRFIDIAKRPDGWTAAEHARSLDAVINDARASLEKAGIA